MKSHELKIWPEYFNSVITPDLRSAKNFEIRRNDRGFQVGDMLHLREYNPNSEEFTGRSTLRLITYIIDGPPFMAEGWVAMGRANPIDGNELSSVEIENVIKAAIICAGPVPVGNCDECPLVETCTCGMWPEQILKMRDYYEALTKIERGKVIAEVREWIATLKHSAKEYLPWRYESICVAYDELEMRCLSKLDSIEPDKGAAL